MAIHIFSPGLTQTGRFLRDPRGVPGLCINNANTIIDSLHDEQRWHLRKKLDVESRACMHFPRSNAKIPYRELIAKYKISQYMLYWINKEDSAVGDVGDPGN